MSPYIDFLRRQLDDNKPVPLTVVHRDNMAALPDMTVADALKGIEMIVAAVNAGEYWAAYNALDAWGMDQLFVAIITKVRHHQFMAELYLLARRTKTPRSGLGFEALDAECRLRGYSAGTKENVVIVISEVLSELKRRCNLH